MKLFGSFYITPEPGQAQRPIIPRCSSPGPCACLGPGSAQCEHTIMDILFLAGHEPPTVSLLHRVFTQHVPDGSPAEGRVICRAVQSGATDGL